MATWELTQSDNFSPVDHPPTHRLRFYKTFSCLSCFSWFPPNTTTKSTKYTNGSERTQERPPDELFPLGVEWNGHMGADAI